MAFFRYRNHNIYYEEIGNGNPLFLLHGNTASSKMFECVIDFYKNDFKLILIDFLGHGKSDRLEKFPADLWYDEAMQVIELIKQNGYSKVNLLGTSGGALVALNVALERSDLVNKVIADSFEGEKSLRVLVDCILNNRQQSKSEQSVIDFWEYNHGEDWENIVDNDTDAVVEHYKYTKDFFHQSLTQLKNPVLLTASLGDEFDEFVDFNEIYSDMLTRIQKGKMHLFIFGGHPAILSNALEFSKMAKEFFESEVV
jgi:pimeloyl-ACP methyl ester carboxylesterase